MLAGVVLQSAPELPIVVRVDRPLQELDKPEGVHLAVEGQVPSPDSSLPADFGEAANVP